MPWTHLSGPSTFRRTRRTDRWGFRPAAYAAGHVPGAVNMPYHSVSHESTAKLSTDAVYVVYDDGLFDNACTKTALRLAALGFRVKELMGGLEGWKAEGYAVAAGTAPGKLVAKPTLARV